jgi:hypothetical protein
MTLKGGTLRTDDMSFLVKAVGKNAVLTPTWAADNWGSVGVMDSHRRGLQLKTAGMAESAGTVRYFDIRGRLYPADYAKPSMPAGGVKIVLDFRTGALLKAVSPGSR